MVYPLCFVMSPFVVHQLQYRTVLCVLFCTDMVNGGARLCLVVAHMNCVQFVSLKRP